MTMHNSDQAQPALATATLARGLEVGVDPRLAAVAAALTAGTPIVEAEHALVTSTRAYLRSYEEHPAVRWLKTAVERTWFLSVAMQTVQLGSPPACIAPRPEDIPFFVQRDFAEPAAQDIAPHLAALWNDAQLATLFEQQVPLWAEVVADTAGILEGLDIVGFEEQFFGLFPYHPVVVPLINLVPTSMNGVGVANQHETYAVCCRLSQDGQQIHPLPVIELAQHESSHPVLEHVLQRFPAVPAACAFLEETRPATGRFALIYDTLESRWTETFVRASTWFFLAEIGRDQEAAEHIQRHTSQGVHMIEPFVRALTPWWQERRAGRAPGLDQVLDQFPDWLRATHS